MSIMKNPFDEHDFKITDDYLEISIKGFQKPMTVINFNGNSETRGIGVLLIANRNQFSNAQEALMILIQRLDCNDDEISGFNNSSKEDISLITTNCLIPFYRNKQIKSSTVDVFQMEYNNILEWEIDFAKGLPGMAHLYPEPWFGIKYNGEAVADLDEFDPLKDEEILESYYFENEWNSREFFAVSKENYIYLDWFSNA